MKRIYDEGNTYHVMSRSNNRTEIFCEDRDKMVFLQVIERYKDKFQFKLYGFVLMDNHFHIIVAKNKHHNISRVMQSILLSYSIYYRKKYNYVGHVWQGRFKSKVSINGLYLKECLAYIHYDPLRAKIVDNAKDYKWSSYLDYQDNINKKNKA